MGNVNKKRELQYLLEDLLKDLVNLAGLLEVGPYEQELIDELHQKVEVLATIQLGQAQVLDSMQYILGELRTGVDEFDGSFILTTKMIDDIQDFLDWEDSW